MSFELSGQKRDFNGEVFCDVGGVRRRVERQLLSVHDAEGGVGGSHAPVTLMQGVAGHGLKLRATIGHGCQREDASATTGRCGFESERF